MMSTLMNIEGWDGTVPFPTILKPKQLWTGKQVFTMLMPRVNVRANAAWAGDDEPEDISYEDAQACTRGALCVLTWLLGGVRPR